MTRWSKSLSVIYPYKMSISLIFATDTNGLFGLDGKIPWSCPKDMSHFQRTTLDTFNETVLVMGRKTFESLPKKLEGRIHVVLSKSVVEGADASFASFDDFLKDRATRFPNLNIFVIGGAKLIETVYNDHRYLVDTIYYSEIQQTISPDSEKDAVYMNSEILKDIKTKAALIKKLETVGFYKYQPKRHPEFQYLETLNDCLSKGNVRQTRNGKTYSMFHKSMTFDLREGFPLLTTKKVFMRGIFEELMFFLKGQTNSKILEDKQVNIWKPNTTKQFIESCGLPYEEGDMGPMYGWNWKHFGAEYESCAMDYSGKGFDQIEYAMNLLKKDPYSRRILMTTYNPAQAGKGVLYPCHSLVIQFYAEEANDAGYLISMNMYQRSVDMACGLPFNIASNALLLHLVCETLNKTEPRKYSPKNLNILLGDIHVYEQHIEGVKEQVSRTPYTFPTLRFNQTHNSIEKYTYDDIVIDGYVSHAPIKYQMIA